MARLLVTGFGPFPGCKVNPTDRLAHAVASAMRRRADEVQALTLPVTYGTGLALLRARLHAVRPDAVLLLGLGSRTRSVRVERFARNNPSILHPDAGGHVAPVVRGDGLPLKARAPVDAALAALRRHGIRARLSPSAGRYLCNAAYATALAQLPAAVPVLFVHVPHLRPVAGTRPRITVARWRPPIEALVPALCNIATLLARRSCPSLKSTPSLPPLPSS